MKLLTVLPSTTSLNVSRLHHAWSSQTWIILGKTKLYETGHHPPPPWRPSLVAPLTSFIVEVQWRRNTDAPRMVSVSFIVVAFLSGPPSLYWPKGRDALGCYVFPFTTPATFLPPVLAVFYYLVFKTFKVHPVGIVSCHCIINVMYWLFLYGMSIREAYAITELNWCAERDLAFL